MAGILSIVGTPIGNLQDISSRAKGTLSSAKLILAEDTREIAKLLNALGIETEAKVISCNQQNELSRIKVAHERMQAGDNIALVSDAGAPCLSDPGGRLVEAIVDLGGDIEVIPGPTALTAALMGAGIDLTRFSFLGFLPKKGKERKRLVENAMNAGLGVAIYESALRTEDTLKDLFEICGSKRAVVARELTKQFETFHRCTLGEPLNPPFVSKGEVVILIEAQEAETERSAAKIIKDFMLLAEDVSLSSKDLSHALQNQFGLKRQDAYGFAMRLKNN